jgi:hypothetical protein
VKIMSSINNENVMNHNERDTHQHCYSSQWCKLLMDGVKNDLKYRLCLTSLARSRKCILQLLGGKKHFATKKKNVMFDM